MKENNLKQTEIGLIPEDWEVMGLGEVCKITMGQSPPSSTYNDEGIGLPFLQGKAEFGEIYPAPVKYCSKPLKIAQEGDILISVRAPVGDVNIAPFKCAIGRGLASIRPLKTERLFIFYFLIYAKKRIEEEGTGSTFKAIRKNNLESFKIPLPSLPEQRKIARVLDKIQQAIELQDRIIEQAKRLKKSLMQKLFTEGLYGEDQKETEIGLIPKSWEVVRLGEICHIVRGGSPRPKGDPKYFSLNPTPIHWIKISDLAKYKQGKFITNTDEFLTEEGKKKSRYLEKGTLILTNSGTIGIPAILGIEGCIHDGYLAFLNLDEKKIYKEFLYYIFEVSKNRFEKLAPKGTQANLNTRILKSFLIPLPPLEEQKQIAHILSTVDRKIEVEQKRKQILKELFKTMLHKLMSGEIRLKEVEV